MTPKLDPKAAIQNISNLYEIIFNHPKESVDKEIKSFVKEFEATRNNRESENLAKCVKFIQDSPNRLIDGKEHMEKNINDVNEKCKLY
ncbi:15243_t:CDS:2 [Entrophospora sp. SA101]|nr:15243_t:CDS:2 [Entrophospora sp. SA101]